MPTKERDLTELFPIKKMNPHALMAMREANRAFHKLTQIPQEGRIVSIHTERLFDDYFELIEMVRRSTYNI
jgi:hypothetical protein